MTEEIKEYFPLEEKLNAVFLATNRNLEGVEFALRRVVELLLEEDKKNPSEKKLKDVISETAREELPHFFKSMYQDLFVVTALLEGIQYYLDKQSLIH